MAKMQARNMYHHDAWHSRLTRFAYRGFLAVVERPDDVISYWFGYVLFAVLIASAKVAGMALGILLVLLLAPVFYTPWVLVMHIFGWTPYSWWFFGSFTAMSRYGDIMKPHRINGAYRTYRRWRMGNYRRGLRFEAWFDRTIDRLNPRISWAENGVK